MADSDKPPPPAAFPRGGAGPPQPVSRRANIALVLISVGTIAAWMAMAYWVFV